MTEALPDWDLMIAKVHLLFKDVQMKRTISFHFDTGRSVWIDPRQTPAIIESDKAERGELQMTMTYLNAAAMLTRHLDPLIALATGRLKIKGDLALAYRVAALFKKMPK